MGIGWRQDMNHIADPGGNQIADRCKDLPAIGMGQRLGSGAGGVTDGGDFHPRRRLKRIPMPGGDIARPN